MTAIAILVPVLGRPNNAMPLVTSIRQSTESEHRILFLCSPGDDDEIAACEETGADVHVYGMKVGNGDYARKINHGFRLTSEEWIFQGADDLRFHPGWDAEALRMVDYQPGVGVIGTHDLGNPRVRRGILSTHSLIRRSYVEERGGSLDGPGVVLHEGYHHNYVDEELCALAIARRAFAFAHRSIVEHLHPHWGKGAIDATYERGLRDFHYDGSLFAQRRRQIRELERAHAIG